MAVQPIQQLSLDTGAEIGFVWFFRSMPDAPSTTVRIFDRNEYYTVHGQNAVFTAKTVYHTTTVLKYLGKGENKLESIALSKPNFESFVRDLLLVLQYRVEVYQCKSKAHNDWTLTYKASPGNLHQLEDIIFGSSEMSTSSCVLAAKLTNENGQRAVGVAYTDSATRHLGVLEFVDNDQFTNMEGLLVQLCPKECLVVANDNSPDAAKLRQVLQRSSVLITERKKAEFACKDIVQDLNRLLRLEEKSSAAQMSEVDLKHAMSSLSALIKYLELLSNEDNFGQYDLVSLDLSQYLRLDSAAARALNLEVVPGEAKTMNLVGLLNKCRTPQGQRLLTQWVKQPLLDRNKIEERLNIVEAFVTDAQLRQSLQEEHLRCMPDFFRLARKLQRGKGTLQDCVRMYQALHRVSSIATVLSGYQGTHKELLDQDFVDPLTELHQDFSKYQELIEATVDLDLAEQHEFVIKPSFDETLTQLREEMDGLESEINSHFQKTAMDLNLEPHKTIKLESNSQIGYYLRVTKKVEKTLRGHKKYMIMETRNDGIRFTYSAFKSLNVDHSSLKQRYLSTQTTLSEEVLKIASGYAEPMLTLNELLAQLDTFVSFAHVATSAPIPYVRPEIRPRGEGNILMRGARHPCLEMQDDVAFIANDVSLIRGEDEFQIITGPNMGGKSTYIRQIGVVVLMAQIGCFVPCSSASISIVDAILARVGAGDSQLKGVSTFMAEMLETSAILRSATKDSLIIIDELGRGTSTYDGFGLAWAISEHIATKIGAFCLFATHFHELTALADVVPCVSNLHVTALTAEETLTLLYRVKPGVCDQSFGIHVAEMAHFPPKVIDFAKVKAAELEVFHCPNNPGSVTDEPAAKRRKEVEEGEELIKVFLNKVKELPLEDMSEEEVRDRLTELKEDILSHDNSFIKGIANSI